MFIIDKETYDNYKYLALNRKYKNYSRLKNIWDERCDKKRFPSVLIIKGHKYDEINFDINPLWWNQIISNFNNMIMKDWLDEILKKNELKIKHLKWFWRSGELEKIPKDKSKIIAEEVFNLLLKFILN